MQVFLFTYQRAVGLQKWPPY